MRRVVARVVVGVKSRWCIVGGSALIGASTLLGTAYCGSTNETTTNKQPALDKCTRAAAFRADLPEYTRADVAAHATKETGIWVTYKEGVFDITKFIAQHPGGAKRIMLAAGGAVDPFWDLYQQHLHPDTQETVGAFLESMRIGNLKKGEAAAHQLNIDDPYVNEPKRHPCLKVHTEKSFNAEPPPGLVGDTYITPNELFYVRHHHPVPQVDVHEYRLSISGRGVKLPLNLTLADLQHLFVKHEMTATLQCGGNRRAGMNSVKPTQGLKWGTGAISTAVFGGVWLRDVLKLAGVEDMDDATDAGCKHVQFIAIDEPFDASIPVHKALNIHGDVMLAYEMNGQTITREHGYPVRVVVPGHLGARSVKWIKSIELSDEEAKSPFQSGIAYKGFGPNVTNFASKDVDVANAPSVQELPVQSAITTPLPHTSVENEDGTVAVKGYAWAGGGRKVVRVDLSSDGGKTWCQAQVSEGEDQEAHRTWAWVLWECDVPLPADYDQHDEVELCCKAVDASMNTQPETPAPIWNLRGILNNSWHRVHVKVVEPDAEE